MKKNVLKLVFLLFFTTSLQNIYSQDYELDVINNYDGIAVLPTLKNIVYAFMDKDAFINHIEKNYKYTTEDKEIWKAKTNSFWEYLIRISPEEIGFMWPGSDSFFDFLFKEYEHFLSSPQKMNDGIESYFFHQRLKDFNLDIRIILEKNETGILVFAKVKVINGR